MYIVIRGVPETRCSRSISYSEVRRAQLDEVRSDECGSQSKGTPTLTRVQSSNVTESLSVSADAVRSRTKILQYNRTRNDTDPECVRQRLRGPSFCVMHGCPGATGSTLAVIHDRYKCHHEVSISPRASRYSTLACSKHSNIYSPFIAS